MPQKFSEPELLEINGVDQWIQIQTNDCSQPVLLILHGGPGYAIMPLFHLRNAVLEDHFIVVNWDQRGAGRSFSSKIPRKSMTFNQFLADLDVLTTYLKQRFERQKIYLLGHSWGTMLGMTAAKMHPKDYYAYIGVGQVISPIANEIAMYEWELSKAKKQGVTKAIKQLTQIGHPNQSGKYLGTAPSGEDPSDTAERWMVHFGGELYKKKSADEIDRWMLRQPVYQRKWATKWLKGLEFSSTVWNDSAAWKLDFGQSIKTLKIPAFFLQGRHDYDTPWRLVEKYVPTLNSPLKQLVWFKKSAHFPFYEESELFNETMIEVVKAKTYPRRR